jgi:hypothetical protein
VNTKKSYAGASKSYEVWCAAKVGQLLHGVKMPTYKVVYDPVPSAELVHA